MAEEKEHNTEKARPICPECKKPIGEGDCQRCKNCRMTLQCMGRISVFT